MKQHSQEPDSFPETDTAEVSIFFVYLQQPAVPNILVLNADVCGGCAEMCMCVSGHVRFLYTVFVLTAEACEAEHANLLCDVVPRPRCPQSLEFSFQLSSHQQDPVGHGLHVVLPWVKETEKSN